MIKRQPAIIRNVRFAFATGIAFWSLGFNSGDVRADYPERLIRAIVPFATGGTNDITARLISPYLSKALG